jgi:hypothetical protein
MNDGDRYEQKYSWDNRFGEEKDAGEFRRFENMWSIIALTS